MPDDRDTQNGRDVVRKGGIAQTDADASDVTRDTYGFTEAAPAANTPDSQEEAKRRAEELLGGD